MSTASLTIIPLRVGQLATNCYILADTKTSKAMIIDPGDDAEYIIDTLLKEKLTPECIVATHGHFDHLLGACAVQAAFGIPVYMHDADAFLVKRMESTAKHFLNIPYVDPPPRVDYILKDKLQLSLGDSTVSIIELPGHTPGSIGIYAQRAATLFVGDTLFATGLVGSTEHQYSSKNDLSHSIATILSYPPHTIVLCGHGEQTTVENEKIFHGV
jgi:glyoxylase-like metal-dependent hydrolase (beta-lactamase superfamily II)